MRNTVTGARKTDARMMIYRPYSPSSQLYRTPRQGTTVKRSMSTRGGVTRGRMPFSFNDSAACSITAISEQLDDRLVAPNDDRVLPFVSSAESTKHAKNGAGYLPPL